LQPENKHETEARTIEDGFWISDREDKDGIGVKVPPVNRDGEGVIDSITFVTIDRDNDDKIVGDVEIYRSEFGRLFQFVDLLKKELE